jgi:hypothetical protein
MVMITQPTILNVPGTHMKRVRNGVGSTSLCMR